MPLHFSIIFQIQEFSRRTTLGIPSTILGPTFHYSQYQLMGIQDFKRYYGVDDYLYTAKDSQVAEERVRLKEDLQVFVLDAHS